MESSRQSTIAPMSPQEWQWFLQEKGLISQEVQWKPGKVAGLTDVSSLPPTATILRECHDNVEECSMRVAQGLLWLHKASFQDFKIVQTALSEAQAQKMLLDKRAKLYSNDLAEKEWNALCSDVGLPNDYITVDTTSISQTIKEWQETTRIPRYQEEMKRIVSQQADFLSKVLSSYQQDCKRLHQPVSHIHTLQQVLSSNPPREYRMETSTHIRNELEELLAFYQARLAGDCSPKHSIPAFMTLVASDNVDMVKSNIEGLGKVLQELKNLQQCGTSMGSNEVQLLETLQSRLRTARERLQENTKQLEEVDAKIQSLQEDVQWCRERIESVKTTLEKEIAELLGDENCDVKIKLLYVI